MEELFCFFVFFFLVYLVVVSVNAIGILSGRINMQGNREAMRLTSIYIRIRKDPVSVCNYFKLN